MTSSAANPWHGRIENDPMLRGEGRFGDDVKPEGALIAAFVRSPHGFGRIEHIDTAAASGGSPDS
jgi:carbon-monoxide dehydrogenase large subunit